MTEVPKKPLVAVILPNSGGSKARRGKVTSGPEALELAAKHFKSKILVDYNPRSGFWTVKAGFFWGRDQDFDTAAGEMLKKAMPTWKESKT